MCGTLQGPRPLHDCACAWVPLSIPPSPPPLPPPPAQVLQCICKTCSHLLLTDAEKRKWSRCGRGAPSCLPSGVLLTPPPPAMPPARCQRRPVASLAPAAQAKAFSPARLPHDSPTQTQIPPRPPTSPPKPPQQVPQPPAGARAAGADVPPRQRPLQAPAHLPPLRVLQRRRQVRGGRACVCEYAFVCVCVFVCVSVSVCMYGGAFLQRDV